MIHQYSDMIYVSFVTVLFLLVELQIQRSESFYFALYLHHSFLSEVVKLMLLLAELPIGTFGTTVHDFMRLSLASFRVEFSLPQPIHVILK